MIKADFCNIDPKMPLPVVEWVSADDERPPKVTVKLCYPSQQHSIWDCYLVTDDFGNQLIPLSTISRIWWHHTQQKH